METGEGEKFRRMQKYRENKMRERLEIKKEIWKQHRERSEMSYRGKKISKRDDVRKKENKLNHSEHFHYILPSMKIAGEQKFERHKRNPRKSERAPPTGTILLLNPSKERETDSSFTGIQLKHLGHPISLLNTSFK